MIKIQSVVREMVEKEFEAYVALAEGYMNMSSYAHRIKREVEDRAKKRVTINSLVVSLSRIRREMKKVKPLVYDVKIKNISTRLPLSEMVYEKSVRLVKELESLHKSITVASEDFLTVTIGTAEVEVICSANLEKKVLSHFKVRPKIMNRNLAAVGISLYPEVFGMANTFFSLLSVTARARVNIEELVSTSTEFIFIVAEKDFARTVALFSELYNSPEPRNKFL